MARDAATVRSQIPPTAPHGPLVLDYYCAKARVCIEVDGLVHDMGSRPQHDTERDSWLMAEGIEVLRIPANEVLADPNGVAQSLVRYCRR